MYLNQLSHKQRNVWPTAHGQNHSKIVTRIYMYLQHQSKVVRILRSLKGKCYSLNYLLQIRNFLFLSHFHYLLLFSSTLLSSIFCYFCCIIFLFLCHSCKFFPANFFIQLNHLTLLDFFPKLLCIIFNQTVCSQISYNVWKCLLLSFNFFAYDCSN